MTIKSTLIALAAFTGVAIAPATMAQEARTDGPRATVTFADINLTSDEGVRVLDRRIRSAARAVCGRPESNVLFGGTARQCLRETIEAANAPRNRIIAAARGESGERLASTSFEIRPAG